MPTASPVGSQRYRPDPAVVDRAVQAIVAACEPKRIVVFGSFARDETHELSDLDLIVVMETSERFVDRIGLIRDACQDVGVEVQPLVYTPDEIDEMLVTGNSFLETALAEGVVAYEAAAA